MTPESGNQPGTEETVDQFVIRTVQEQLAGLNAADPDWDPSTQTRFLRLLAEQGIEKLEAADEEYFDYVVQCILLAGENMQDARIQILEQRVDKLENPPVDLAETLLQAALMLVAELVIAHGAFAAVPALFGFATTRNVSRRLAKVEVKVGAWNTKLDGEVAKARELIDTNLGKRRDILRRVNQADFDGDAAALSEAHKSLRLVDRETSSTQRWLQTVEAARARSDEMALRVKAGLESGKAADEGRMKELLDGVGAAVTVGRAGEALGEDFASTITDLAAGTLPSPSAFETSGILADYLTAVEADRRISRDTWSALRLHVRFVPDDDFYQSAVVQHVLALAAEADYWSVQPATFGRTQRTVFVLGFEMMLWLHWFVYNALLTTRPFTDEPWPGAPGVLRYGHAVNGRLVTNRASDLGGAILLASGHDYPGARQLSEEHTKYLYEKFVRRHYLENPKTAPAPITFDVERYDETWKMPENGWLGPNLERDARVEEIKILIVEYFRYLEPQLHEDGAPSDSGGGAGGAGQRIRNKMRDMIGLDPGDDPLQELLDRMPDVDDDPGPLELSQPTRRDLDFLATELATADRGDETWLIGDRRGLLESAIIDLELQIANYENGTSSTDDPLQTIEILKDRLRVRQGEFLEVAAADPQQAAAVQAQHGDRIRTLLAWAPIGSVANWRWFGPDEQPSAPTTT